jgi:hypothetical protein
MQVCRIIDQKQRDEHSVPMFGVTCGFATLEPLPPEMQRLLGATAASQEAQDQFVGRIMAAGEWIESA